MAALAQSNEFSIFISKIGYSVGLEFTLERLRDFATVYAGKDSLSYADISRLVQGKKPEGWGLDNFHVLDVLQSLGVVSVRKGQVSVLEVGETLGILKRLQLNDQLSGETFDRGLMFIFAHALVQADGDIFLNALASDFDPEEFRNRLHRMIEHKWSILEQAFKTKSRREALYRTVNIEAQENNPGSRGLSGISRTAIDPNRLAPKLGPLRSTVSRPEIKISAAYLRKALPRRKAWALSLGLCNHDGGLTPQGSYFLSCLQNAGYAGPTCLCLWPLKHEIINPKFIGLDLAESIPVLSSWDFLCLIGSALQFLPPQARPKPKDMVDELQTVLTIFETYRSLNLSKSILRVELPVRVAYRCFLVLHAGAKTIAPLPDLIAAEQHSRSPRIIARPSRIAEFGLST
ncbi:hypothetical protein QA641_09865 [Bradyrhizobium sp. CB1650]|uniref:hypothetical protein n=1 Tax=Bradyrhizobium sp. CB1650 TaxID=3039153 RepID=UPI00243542B4|nr:hypothetical protein [Bradyrhizobium sp. CB1650]WGD54165.1 hypothetical protein QA641_09865 [Bradyrhizobium sp. CB1650]